MLCLTKKKKKKKDFLSCLVYVTAAAYWEKLFFSYSHCVLKFGLQMFVYIFSVFPAHSGGSAFSVW